MNSSSQSTVTLDAQAAAAFPNSSSSQSTITLDAQATSLLINRITTHAECRLVSNKRKLVLVFIFPNASAAESNCKEARPRMRTPLNPHDGDVLSKQVLGNKYAALDSSGVTNVPCADFQESTKVKLPSSLLADTDAMMDSIHSFMTDCYARSPHTNPNYSTDTYEGFRTLFALNPGGLLADCPPTSVHLVDYHQTSEPQLVFPVELIGQYLHTSGAYSKAKWDTLTAKGLALHLTRPDNETTYKLSNWGTPSTRKYANIYLDNANDCTSGKYGNGGLTEMNYGEFVEVRPVSTSTLPS